MSINMSIDRFVSKLNTGLASPARYEVIITPPDLSTTLGSLDNSTADMIPENMALRCHAVQFPSRSINPIVQKQLIVPFQLPFSMANSPVILSFYASDDLRERKWFEIWQEKVINVYSGVIGFYRDYIGNVLIQQLDKEGNVTYDVMLFEVYPTTIGAIDYSYSTSNSFLNTTVTLAFKNWDSKRY